jgi:hypothetical protein
MDNAADAGAAGAVGANWDMGFARARLLPSLLPLQLLGDNELAEPSSRATAVPMGHRILGEEGAIAGAGASSSLLDRPFSSAAQSIAAMAERRLASSAIRASVTGGAPGRLPGAIAVAEGSPLTMPRAPDRCISAAVDPTPPLLLLLPLLPACGSHAIPRGLSVEGGEASGSNNAAVGLGSGLVAVVSCVAACCSGASANGVSALSSCSIDSTSATAPGAGAACEDDGMLERSQCNSSCISLTCLRSASQSLESARPFCRAASRSAFARSTARRSSWTRP